MSDLRRARQQLFEVFQPSYWGTPQELHPITKVVEGNVDVQGFVDVQTRMHKAWHSIMGGTAIEGCIQNEVTFDAFDPDSHFQPGTVLLLDTERLGTADDEAPRLATDGNSIKTTANIVRGSASALLRHMHQSKQLTTALSANARLPHPEMSDTTYTRTVLMVGFALRAKGGTSPLIPSKFGLMPRKGIGRPLVAREADTLHTEGMLEIGTSYQERDQSGEPTAIKRIRSLAIIRS